jgi:DNA-binding response OmpR family regulator
MRCVVLIVEDDAATLSGLAAYIQQAGYSTVPAATFEEAHRLLPFVRPDVAVVDVRLGEYNGLQVVVEARSLVPRPAVIVTSGFDDPVLKAEAVRLGATFMLKPLVPERLLALIAEMVNARNSQE